MSFTKKEKVSVSILASWLLICIITLAIRGIQRDLSSFIAGVLLGIFITGGIIIVMEIMQIE